MTAASAEPAFQDFVSADVVGRYAFYNTSAFDGSLDGAADDLAIAIDKRALLPGQTATFENYTSYSRGLNGIMVDIAGLPGSPAANDFNFQIWNTAQGTWNAAPAPASVAIRPGAGQAGSDRVSLTWDVGSVTNTWLRVTVRSTPATGLSADDVFYFGNIIGETGDNLTDAFVTESDTSRIQANPLPSGAAVANPFDLNRDGKVDALDSSIATTQQTTPQTAVPLITALETEQAPAWSRPQPELFNWGDAGFAVIRIPLLTKAPNGDILAFAEGRSATQDFSSRALIMRRSSDGGQTWSPISVIYSLPVGTGSSLNMGSPVVDWVTGEIFLLFTRDNSEALVTRSPNSGYSWSTPEVITSSVKVVNATTPVGHSYPAEAWGWYVFGPGQGIQLTHGPSAGRLVVAADHRVSWDLSVPSYSHVVYSDDHGATWHLGGGLDATAANAYSNEAALVEQSDGTIYMSIRVNDRANTTRGYARSYDGGRTWTTMRHEAVLTTPAVEGALLRVNDQVVLFSSPSSTDNSRQKLTIWASYDDTKTWVKKKVLFFGAAAYSDMVLVAPDTVLLVYERGHDGDNTNWFGKIGLARFNMRWLESDDPYQFTWHFNESTAGQEANVFGASVQDYGPWDQRAQAGDMDNPPLYVTSPTDRAMRLTEGSDYVRLTQKNNSALQFGALDSFTVETTFRTTDSDGILIGGSATGPRWAIAIANGYVEVQLADQSNQVVTRSTSWVADGDWHQVTVVRNGVTRALDLWVDGTLTSTVDTTSGSLMNTEAVDLGQFADGIRQLTVDIDALRITRAALAPESFMDAAAPIPQPPPLTPPLASAPSNLAGLQFWLPTDPSHFFADSSYADPLPLSPAPGTGAHSAVDASPNAFRIHNPSMFRFVRYGYEPLVGPAWLHGTDDAAAGAEWTVANSNGTQERNFDFVQNTGRFTLSTFVRIKSVQGGYVPLFDTAEATIALPGFSLLVNADGTVRMVISAADGTTRFAGSAAEARVALDSWYHIAATGSGPGEPIKYYITPITADAVAHYQSSQFVTGPDGNYPTDSNHDLTIGGRARLGDKPFSGWMVDTAIFDRALSEAEIQHLFEHTRNGDGQNHAPGFRAGPNVRVELGAGEQIIPKWAQEILAGRAYEANQSLSFEIVANTRPSLFAVAPTIDARTGDLRFTPVANVAGVAAITVQLVDDSQSVDGRSLPVTFTIDVNGPRIPYVIGDMNRDGRVDNFDIGPAELVLTNAAAYLERFPDCGDYRTRGDLNRDGVFNNFDLSTLHRILTRGNLLGDMNDDGVLNNFDMTPFQVAASGEDKYLQQYPWLTDYALRGDINGDGRFDNFDVGAFEKLLAAGSSIRSIAAGPPSTAAAVGEPQVATEPTVALTSPSTELDYTFYELGSSEFGSLDFF